MRGSRYGVWSICAAGSADFAASRTIWHILPTKSHADIADVIAVIKRPQRYCVLTTTINTQLKGIPLAGAVGKSIIGEHFSPDTAIHADVSPLNTTRRVFDVKCDSHAVTLDLGLA